MATRIKYLLHINPKEFSQQLAQFEEFEQESRDILSHAMGQVRQIIDNTQTQLNNLHLISTNQARMRNEIKLRQLRPGARNSHHRKKTIKISDLEETPENQPFSNRDQ